MLQNNMSKNIFWVVLAATIFNCCLCGEVNFKSCDVNSKGTVSSISVAGCDTSMERCILKRNTNVSLEITFETDINANELMVVVHGILLDVPVPFPIGNPDGCKDSNIECPIKAGTTYVYKNSLPVLKKYPRVTVDVMWQIQSPQNNCTIMCAIIPAKLG